MICPRLSAAGCSCGVGETDEFETLVQLRFDELSVLEILLRILLKMFFLFFRVCKKVSEAMAPVT
jgi:hypothetical protein